MTVDEKLRQRVASAVDACPRCKGLTPAQRADRIADVLDDIARVNARHVPRRERRRVARETEGAL